MSTSLRGMYWTEGTIMDSLFAQTGACPTTGCYRSAAAASARRSLHFALGGGGLLASFSASATQPPPIALYKFA